MSKNKYTRGPWLLLKAKGDGRPAVFGADGRKIARVASGNSKANARLIAAAPDLLDALEQAVTSMQDSGYPNTHVVVRAARAAIAKATGGAA